MDVHLTEDEMAGIKRDVLEKLRPYLCHKIRAVRHLDYLRSRRIIMRDDAEEITSHPTQTQRTGHLLDILCDNPCGLDALIDSIQMSRCQNFIIVKITDEVQKAKNEKIEALRASNNTNNLGIYRVTSVTTNDFSRTYSEESTMLYHPDGEESPCPSNLLGALDPKSLQKGGGASAAGWDMPLSSSSHAPSTLPGPGDPGAPALPDEVLAEESSSPAGDLQPHQCSGGDPNFQPLRSRSLSPMVYFPSNFQ